MASDHWDRSHEYGDTSSEPAEQNRQGLQKIAPISIFAENESEHFPANNAIDGNPATLWKGGDSQTGSLQVDLGKIRKIESLHFELSNPPKLVSGPSRYKIFISDDNEAFYLVDQRNSNSGWEKQDITIGRTFRYLRLEYDKINDGTRWEAGISELWFQENTSSTGCDDFASPANLQSKLDLESGVGREDFKTLCLDKGTYPGPYLINDVEKLRIISHDGIVALRADFNATDLPFINNIAIEGTLQIFNSREVVVEGLTVVNDAFYEVVSESSEIFYQLYQVVRAVSILESHNVTLKNSSIISGGKQTIKLLGAGAELSRFAIEGCLIRGGYFVIDSNLSRNLFQNNTFVSDLSFVSPNDGHSLLWVFESINSFVDSRFILVTGVGVFSGARGDITVDGKTFFASESERYKGSQGWVHSHKNYKKIVLNLSGELPLLDPYYYNDYQNIEEVSEGHLVCRHFENQNREAICSQPLAQ